MMEYLGIYIAVAINLYLILEIDNEVGNSPNDPIVVDRKVFLIILFFCLFSDLFVVYLF